LVEQLTKLFCVNENTPLQKISDPLLDQSEINLFIKREDLNHPYLSGNKWHKLKYNLVEALDKNYETILTFGGAYSNHIYAAASAGKVLNLRAIGIIRGEEHLPLNPTLKFAEECGMELHYIDRTAYRDKTGKEFIQSLRKRFGRFYLIPEGGTNELAVKGCSDIVKNINIDYDYLCCACGTGGTFAGLVTGLNGKQKALAFSVLKGADFLTADISGNVKKFSGKKYSNWELILDYHFGGYAKYNNELLTFIKNFSRVNNIPLEPIYTGKLLFGIFDMIRKKKFNKGDTIVAIHTGGLQGLDGLALKNGFDYLSDEFEVNREYFNKFI